MAAPHVAGAAALFLEANRFASPQAVASALLARGTRNLVSDAQPGSPNILLYSGDIARWSDQTPPVASISAPAAGATVSGTVRLAATVTDNVAIREVQFVVDRRLVGTDTGVPYEALWDSRQFPNGQHELHVRAIDSSGNYIATAARVFVVSNPGRPWYDTGLHVLKCAVPYSECDSLGLLNGRGPLGPEPNAPNTINNSCADGVMGNYLMDESLERLRIRTLDGSTLAPGKAVAVDATVHAYSTTDNFLDVYAAGSASAPIWNHVGTIRPAATGLTTVSLVYTLPAGTVQAVRGVFRYGESAQSCPTGNFTDVDDLAFVADGVAPTTSVTSPAAGSVLSSTATITATASDTHGVARVVFYDGSSIIGTDTTSPYSVTWDTTKVANGSHELTTRAYDVAGNSGVSASVTITVSNGSPPGPSQLIVSGGFEPTVAGWVKAGAAYFSTGGVEHTGIGYGYLAKANGVTGTLSQTITIPATAAPSLSFWLNVTSDEQSTTVSADKLFVDIISETGTLLQRVATFSNLDRGVAGAYVLRSGYSLAPFAGQTVRLQFRAVTDSVNVSAFRLDDVSVTFSPPAVPELVVSGGFEPTVSAWIKTGASYFSTGGVEHAGVGYGYLAKANGVTGSLSQTIAIPANAAPSLSFWLNVTSDESGTTASDKLFVEVLSSAGSLLATLATYSNLQKGITGAYGLQSAIPLAAYAGQTIRLQFRAVTDAVNVTTFRIDDVSVR
jgi:hypothetical protein